MGNQECFPPERFAFVPARRQRLSYPRIDCGLLLGSEFKARILSSASPVVGSPRHPFQMVRAVNQHLH